MLNLTSKQKEKPLRWVGNSKKELLGLPGAVIDEVGYALWKAQLGKHHRSAKPLKGFSGVYEIVTEYDTNAYRAVYVVNLADTVYVLHAFQKKSKRGIKTPSEVISIIKERLKAAKRLASEEQKK